MTTYHLEHRAPREGESYLPSAFVAECLAITQEAHDDFEPTSYVFTPDRPRGKHPEGLLIRVNGELYGRTYVPESNEAAYNSVNDCTDFQYASDIDEWEDVYDEVPDHEPEPEPEWPDPPVIVIEEGGRAGQATTGLPVVAVRKATGGYVGDYLDELGRYWVKGLDVITAWHEYVPDGYVPQEKVYEAAAQGAAAAAPEPHREYTADDLDNLEAWSCVWDGAGYVWQQDTRGSWYVAGSITAHGNPLADGSISHAYSAPSTD